MTYEQLIVEKEGAVATVRMNNPAKLNALSSVMTSEMTEALENLRADDEVRAIVIRGEGRGFSAGADLGALKEPYLKGERPQLSGFLKEGYNRLIPLLSDTPKPVIAAINGVVAGAGLSLACACDMRIAGDEASFSTAFMKIGLIPDSGACYFLPRTVGTAKALELAITGEKFDAQAALEMGLVSRVVPSSDLAKEAHDLAQRLADLPTATIGLVKKIFREAAHMTLQETLDREAEVQDEAAATHDHMEGVVAFLEKRPATFTGK